MIPSLRLVEDIPEWGTLVALVGGEHHGANVLLVPAARILPGDSRRHGSPPPERGRWRLIDDDLATREVARVEATRRAEALLESLLDDRQRAQWRSRRGFWVPTPFGEVELGRISHLRFNGVDGTRLVLCVLPTRFSELPDADIWTNLLLVLHAEPLRFFGVANYRTPRGAWQPGPVPLALPRSAVD
jgi:hypothetical protein